MLIFIDKWKGSNTNNSWIRHSTERKYFPKQDAETPHVWLSGEFFLRNKNKEWMLKLFKMHFARNQKPTLSLIASGAVHFIGNLLLPTAVLASAESSGSANPKSETLSKNANGDVKGHETKVDWKEIKFGLSNQPSQFRLRAAECFEPLNLCAQCPSGRGMPSHCKYRWKWTTFKKLDDE